MENATSIKCPKCGTSIDVQNALASQMKSEMEQSFQKQLLDVKDVAKAEAEKEHNKNLKLEKEKIKKNIKEEHKGQIEELNKELNEKSEQVKELNTSKAEVEKLKREKSELKEVAEAEAQKRLTEALSLEKGKIKKSEEKKSELKIKELQTQLGQQKKLAEDMMRKQEQGSMQLQGEAQELGIEGWLKEKFPLDIIQEIKKGAKGGDCIHTVNNELGINCGTIYYESKRTKKFQLSWIEKFKKDIQNKKTDIGILVTQVMPSDMDRMGMKEGIWICTYDEFKGLCGILRESLIQINSIKNNQEDKGDKVHLLYDFLTSNEFKMQINAIVEGFSGMQSGLDSEKRAMQKIWKQREKQIDKVIENTIDMYGSIKGIGGNAIQKVERLELGYDAKNK